MPTFKLNGHEFVAQDCVDDILINPELPEAFDDTPNDERPADQQKWWKLPYIETMTTEDWDRHYAGLTGEHAAKGRAIWENEDRAKWLAAWPSGIRYDVRCLDGGAWDRSTGWGMFKTLEEALHCAKGGQPWGKIAMLDRWPGETE